MLLILLLLNLLLPSLTDAGADAMEGFENLLESRLREMVTRMQDEKEKQATEFEAKIKDLEERLELKDKVMEMRLEELEDKMEERLEEMKMKMEEEKERQAEEKKRLEARNKEMDRRLEELEDKMKEKNNEMDKMKRGFEASTSKLRIEVEESLRKEITFNNALMTKPSLRDLPIILISAYQSKTLSSPQTVTFERFLVNYNNHDRPGGGDAILNLDSGIFTCLTPGYYTVTISAHAVVSTSGSQLLFLYKNGAMLPESEWHFGTNNGVDLEVTASRMLVSNRTHVFKKAAKHKFVPQTLHMDAGDALELRMIAGENISRITLNIELVGLGFDYRV